jgi:uncharacterized protein YwqG
MNKEQLKQLFEENHLSRIWEIAAPKIKNGIRITLNKKNEEHLPLGQSKIGGLPDLPTNMNWFTAESIPMSFIAQINLAELHHLDLENKLPATGMLYFFYDASQETWGYDPEDKEKSKVYHYKGAVSTLERKEKPELLEDWAFFDAASLTYSSAYEVPDYQSSLMEEVNLSDEEYDSYYNLNEDLNEGNVNKVLGHSNNIQGGMEYECELVSNGFYCGDATAYEDPKAQTLKDNSGNWNLLLQIDSNEEECGMMWGDSGRLYFWIKDADLKEEKFENSWLILQCC